ncbi:efflux RND transporter permease subunit, partial [bacterium]|nr:efflux RND transporter permease subunit [bacterium]
LRKTNRSDQPTWLTLSQLTIVPFYDRTGLIYETLGTLNDAISQQVLVTIIVILIMLMHLSSSALICSMLPLTVLLCFIGMKLCNVQANIVALSGIAIAIGTIVDMGIIICENILRHLEEADPNASRLEVIHRASAEVGNAVVTAVLTTVVSFLPVFTMIGAEGKLFKPLAYTKTFALISSIMIALTILPPAAHLFFCGKIKAKYLKQAFYIVLILGGILLAWTLTPAGGVLVVLFCIYRLVEKQIPDRVRRWTPYLASVIAIGFVAIMLSSYWEPLGPERGLFRNLLFVAVLIGILLGSFKMFQYFYPRILSWALNHKLIFLSIPVILIIMGTMIWLGFGKTFGWLPDTVEQSPQIQRVAHWFPGLGKEFMPDLDEGSFLFMPTTMTHASIGEVIDILQKQDTAFQAIPEIESVAGKLGRAETPLDPAPISMIETVINYKSEFVTDNNGRRKKFKFENGEFVRDEFGMLIPDKSGRPFRQWREHIRSPNDIWNEIIKAAKIPGTTSAPKLQPIAARIVMLQSGMRAPMGVKVKGSRIEEIEGVALQIENFLKEVPSVEASTVIADRIVGKPYIEIIPDRQALARFGISIRKFHDVIEIAIGGKRITSTVDGRERFPVRVRYNRELRDSIEAFGKILVPGTKGRQIPITELAQIHYVRGPQVIKSEDTFLVGYVVFDKKEGYAEVDVVEQCQAYLKEKIANGEFNIPHGVTYTFAGSYENQLRAAKTLTLILPLALFIIFMLIYFQFRSVGTTFLIFTGVFVAWSGGFILIWLYAQPWFLNFSVFGMSLRTLFQINTINMSVAVWVGFLALFGIATDDGVVMSTYLVQVFRDEKCRSKAEIRELVIKAGTRRVHACLMTTATTILALIPVLTSTGRGSDIMVPMAIPSFGGMLIEIITMLIVPVLYSLIQELRFSHAVLNQRY